MFKEVKYKVKKVRYKARKGNNTVLKNTRLRR